MFSQHTACCMLHAACCTLQQGKATTVVLGHLFIQPGALGVFDT